MRWEYASLAHSLQLRSCRRLHARVYAIPIVRRNIREPKVKKSFKSLLTRECSKAKHGLLYNLEAHPEERRRLCLWWVRRYFHSHRVVIVISTKLCIKNWSRHRYQAKRKRLSVVRLLVDTNLPINYICSPCVITNLFTFL